ncbi:hypothetical protein SLEP1_g51549 [Rubroshorea leprosula]|uniref:Uncharacterized protein n=1 Tax=Rubroshorea leprosula TaxID=152421 RepID=A0AAV5M4B2_9ROSI|nr:hypothetical protein SLEP1_g51549 [Rubroshorea leprosula]
MSTSDDVGHGVRASGNVINNNGANNSGIGSGGQNYGQGSASNYGTINTGNNHGQGSGSNYITRNTGNTNIGPGAGGINSGIGAGGINSGIFNSEIFSSGSKTAEKSDGRGTESASMNTENSHGVEKGEAKATAATSNLAMRLLKNLNNINEDRDVSLARFGMVPSNDPQVVGKFAVPAMLEKWACHLLKNFPNLTTHSKAKKGLIEDTFLNLCAAMQYMEVTPFAKMNEDFFYLCRDAIDDADSINFEVSPIRAHLLNLAKAYLGKVELGMVGRDTVGNLDEGIEEQGKHVEEMEKSLAKMKELILKLTEGLMSVKAYLESLNQENEYLSSNDMIELCQTCIKIAKTFGDKPGPFQP